MPASSEEEILGIFPSFVQKGAGEREWLTFKGLVCRLVFTTHRLIIAEDNRRGGNKLLYLGNGPYYLFSQVSARDRLKMKEQSPEDFPKANVENPEIPYSDIKVAEMVKPPVTNWRLCLFTVSLDVPEYTLTIAPPKNERYVDEFKEFLAYVLPGKV